MADNVNKNSIDDIVSGVRKTLESGEISGSGMQFEFEFDDGSNDSAAEFVFETSEPKEQAAPEEKAEPQAEPKQTLGTESEVKEDSAPKDEPKEEVKAESEKEKIDAAALGIWTTYVPRFSYGSFR